MSTDKPPIDVEAMKDIAQKLSEQIIRITTEAGSGHPSSSLSAIDIMTVLYFGGILKHDPSRPDWAKRDRFILSKGHAAPGLYAVLAEAGYFDSGLLSTFRKIGSRLEGHPNMRRVPGVEASTGSLGQGLSIGLGHALAARLNGVDYMVYVMIGDGECDQGQIWEAAMASAKFEVSNLIAIVDFNKFQQTGPVEEIMPSLRPLGKKWEAFGWTVSEIDGHDVGEIFDAFAQAKQERNGPHVIIAHTLKGRGLSVFEENEVNRMHGKPVKEERVKEMLDELYSNQSGEN